MNHATTGVEGTALQPHLVRAIEPYVRCHLACVEVYPSIGMVSRRRIPVIRRMVLIAALPA
jgi:hypothetical protein